MGLIVTSAITLGLYWLSHRYKTLEIGEAVAVPQRGYDINGVNLRDGRHLKGLYGFPTMDNPIFRTGRETQAPIVRVRITNPNDSTVTLTSVRLRAANYRQGEIYVGNGEMVAGSQYRQYECILSGRVDVFEATVSDPNSDFNVVKAHDQETLEIVVRSTTAGVFDLIPVIEYQLGRRKISVELNPLKPIAFFQGPPPQGAPQM